MALSRLARIRARRRVKVLPRAVRWARSPHPPNAVELTYVLALKRLAGRWTARAKALLLPLAKRRAAAVRHDADDSDFSDFSDVVATSGYEAALSDAAFSEELDDAITELGGSAFEIANSAEFATAQKTTARKAVANSVIEFKRLGIKLRQGEPKMDAAISGWRAENVDLITTLFDYEKEKLRDLLEAGEGIRYETLSERIFDRFDMTLRHAELIARDQTLKLNADITTSRMEAAGVVEFVWTTAGDERVRPMHAELDGQTFSYDDPPITNRDGDHNLPGGDYQCRCVPTPVLPELQDAEDDDQSEDLPMAAE